MNTFRIHLYTFTAVIIALLMPLRGSHAADADSPLLESFKSRHSEVIQQAEQGKLPATIGKRAEDLWLSLRKDLIYLDAQVQAYKLEAKETHGTQQEEAIQKLVDVSAERERLLINALRSLDKLTKGEISEIPISSSRPGQQGSVTISIEPEDLTNPYWGD
ncbi:MAG: hypothetical protein ABFS45_07210 [Pseudomonadota bacterium]